MRRTRSAKTALSSIARNRLRTALTMLGLVIGISSVIVLVGIGEGSNRQVEERMKALGGDMVSAYVFKDSLGYDDIAALRGLPGMGSVAPSKGVGGDLTDEGRSTKRSTAEVSDEHYLTTRSLRLATGRNLSPVDRENRSNVCVIGASTANDLFGTMDCLGKTLKIAGVPFVVVGVLEPIGQTMGLNADNLALVPFSALPSLGEETKIETVYARPALEEINQTMTLMLVGIASISLVVAGIGVMNVMLVSVTERTREIGIKKALGARRSDILRQFLMEALLVSLMGGAAGISAGLAFGMLARSMGLAFSASWDVVAVAVAASTAIGLAFGIFPAYRASRLTPIEALRQE